MKTKTEPLLVAGKYGYGARVGRRIVCDPCYIDDEGFRSKLDRALNKAFPQRWTGPRIRGERFKFKGRVCRYWQCSDGTGPFGCSVDSGGLVMATLSVWPEKVKALINAPNPCKP